MNADGHQATGETAPPEEHERVHLHQEVLPRGSIVRVLFAALSIGAALCFGAYVLQWSRIGAIPSAAGGQEQAFPAPHEVSGVREQLFRIANAQPSSAERDRRLLDGYGWVDRDRRLVRIPIERAVDLVVARGGARR